jgi:hypothetical protein
MYNVNGRTIVVQCWLFSSLLILLFATSAEKSYGQISAPSWAQSGQQVIISPRTIQHIHDRHWPGSPAQGAGKYAPGITVRSLRDMINEAVANGRARENTNGRPGRVYEYDFGHPIGTTINGEPATRLRVVVNPRNQVVTAFPI